MSLGSEYCQQLHEELRRHAVYPPNEPISLGDYGSVRDHVFQRRGNVRQLGVLFETLDGTGQSSFQFKSKGNVDFQLIAKGDIQPGGVPAVKAGLELKFSRENAVFFAAAGCTVKAISDVRALEHALLKLLEAGEWDTDHYVVTELNTAAKTTIIASADRNCEVKLEASSPAIEAIHLGDASLALEVKHSKNTSLEIVTENNQSPLMQLCRLRGIFHKELQPELVAGHNGSSPFRLAPDEEDLPAFEPALEDRSMEPVDTDEAEAVAFLRSDLEAVPSDFEVGRAITAYIPLLYACYEFAHGNEHPDIPAGFEIVAPIRSQIEEGFAESVEQLGPEARAAIENDFRALDEEVIHPGDVSIEEGIANPSGFGFVFREIHTGALVIGIRGTQTAEEWVKNFTAVPFPFEEAPDFGLVHLGFAQMWRRIRPAVFETLQSLPANARITFLGHSLGGAMATLGAVDATLNLPRPSVDLCTFGSPRVGKILFRMHFNHLIERAYRVAELRDIVPHVPPIVTAWNHVGLHIAVRSADINPHSLASYLEGLQKIGAPLEVPVPATEAEEESLALAGATATRLF